MVHAENGDVDRRAREAGARGGQHRAELPRAHAPARDRGRGDEPGHPALAGGRLPALRRPRLLPGGDRADRDRAREGLGRLGRDLHAVLLQSTTTFLEKPDFEGAKYVYTPPAARRRRTRTCSGTPSRTTSSRSISTDHCAFLWDGQKTLGKDDFSKIPNGGPGPREPAADDPRVRRAPGTDLAQPDGGAPLDEPRQVLRALPPQGDDCGRLRRRPRRLRSREEG